MSLDIPFENTYARLDPAFYTRLSPTPVKAPRLLAWNADLAETLGIESGPPEERAQVFGGNKVPADAEPLAQIYAGHQFGNYNPQLGDGRAILLGEVVDANRARYDIQLKGSGPTPYSRMGDGRAWLGPVLREFIVSEAMHALGVPTTRALAAVATGEPVYREQGGLPGAVLTRVAASHLRVGTFQLFAQRGQLEHLEALVAYAIERHYPESHGPLELLEAVVERQAALIPHWMSVGFIHGVMNTDNCTISGETIDYGPCAFMDAYHPARVFSSIDQMGRYAFGNQPSIAVWNMAQFATALIQICPDKDKAVEDATAIIHAMPDRMQRNWLKRFAAKLGIGDARPDDQQLVEDLLGLMQTGGSDFANTFAALRSGSAAREVLDQDGYADWHGRWQARLANDPKAMDILKVANPVRIPRNHRIEQVIAAAVADDFEPFETMWSGLCKPFEEDANFSDLTKPPTDDEIVPATFCGT